VKQRVLADEKVTIILAEPEEIFDKCTKQADKNFYQLI